MNAIEAGIGHNIHRRRGGYALSTCIAGLAVALAAGCTSSAKTSATSDASAKAAADAGGGTCSAPGKASSGAADSHCGSKVQATSAAACHPDAGTMQSTTGADAGSAPQFGDTMYGMQADDDDCKYHVSWTATSLCENADVYFTVKVTTKTDGNPLKGADTMPDISLNDTHPGMTEKSKTVEGPDGTYKVGPVRFDAAGKWTVRFHFNGNCDDFTDDSPHGHAAFYVDVP